MSSDKWRGKNKAAYDSDAEDESGGRTGDSGAGGASGASGAGGHIEFHDFLASDQYTRDDLTSAQQKQLLSMHESGNEARVLEAKKTSEARDALRSGDKHKASKAYGHGAGGGGTDSNFKPHMLSTMAQFSGEKKVNPVPSEMNLDENANKGDRNDLQNQYSLKYQLRNTPSNAPKLTRN